jgi:hypothetical protein
MRAEEILKEAQATLIDRGLNYDSDGGERTMDVLVPAFNMITGHNLTRKQGYLFMVLLKAARSQQGADKMDNWVDMAAYAGLAGEAE